jgi:hypothetical protein
MRNVREVYRGQSYDSKKEARYAAQLDVRAAAGEIFTWTKGASVYLKAGNVQLVGPSGRRMYYRPDFEVTHMDGRVELVDVKGRKDTKDPVYRLYWLKREVLRAMGVSITEV